MEKAKGAMGNIQEHIGAGGRTVRPPEENPKTLSEMGLTKDKSSTCTYVLISCRPPLKPKPLRLF